MLHFDEENPGKKVDCFWCKWEGTLKDCKKRWVSSNPQSWRMLAGREGWEWRCPKCKMTVHSHYIRMS